MATLKGWASLLDRGAQARPFRFVHGMRHPVGGDFHCSLHVHRDAEIVYHPFGKGTSRLGAGGEIAFGEGSVVVYAPGEPHDQSMSRPGEDWCVQVALPPPRRGEPRAAFHLPRIGSGAVLEELRLLSASVPAPAASRAILNLRATALLLALVQEAEASRSRAEADPRRRHVLRAEAVLRERFASIGSLREVAEEVGIGADHLRHAFRAVHGMGMARWLNGLRVERARTLLAHSTLPLKQVAALAGFRDEYYFSAVFRRAVGAAPGRYRLTEASGGSPSGRRRGPRPPARGRRGTGASP